MYLLTAGYCYAVLILAVTDHIYLLFLKIFDNNDCVPEKNSQLGFETTTLMMRTLVVRNVHLWAIIIGTMTASCNIIFIYVIKNIYLNSALHYFPL